MEAIVADSQPTRMIHCVGTMNCSTEEGMRTFVGIGGDHASLVPTEGGERRRWIVPALKAMDESPALFKVKPGGLGSGLPFLPVGPYLTLPWYYVRDAGAFELDLGYAPHAQEALSVLKALKAETHKPLRLQIGLPDPNQLPGFTQTPALRQFFVDATVGSALSIKQLVDKAGCEVVFQLDMPYQTVLVNLVAMLSAKRKKQVIAALTRRFQEYLLRFPSGAKIGIHLCYGHKDDKALAHPKSVAVTLELARALSEAVTANVTLEYVHVPFATAERPPEPNNVGYLRPLVEMEFYNPTTKLIAGFVHKGGLLDSQLRVRDTIEEFWGQPVDNSGVCGFGEDPLRVMKHVLRKQVLLAAG